MLKTLSSKVLILWNIKKPEKPGYLLLRLINGFGGYLFRCPKNYPSAKDRRARFVLCVSIKRRVFGGEGSQVRVMVLLIFKTPSCSGALL